MDKVKEVIERLERIVCCELEQDPKTIDYKGVGEVTDALKDCCEALHHYECYKAAKKCNEEKSMAWWMLPWLAASGQSERYYTDKRMLPMMDGDEYNKEWERDMDKPLGRMYYPMMRDNVTEGRSGTFANGARRTPETQRTMSRYGYSHDEYMKKRDQYSKDDPEDKRQRKELLDEYLNDMVEMGKEVVADMTPEEKQLWKQKITKLMTL